MQSTADTNNIAVNIAENISILHLLHEVPEPPTSNPVLSPISDGPTEYSLSFKKERDLTIMLAYISSIKNNRDRVPAVCIKEDKATDRLDILVAVNASNAAEKGVLSNIQTKFEEIFKLLPSASTSRNAEKDIFDKIVEVCYTRILERLRLVSRKDKPPMEEHVSDSIDNLEQESLAFAKAAKDLLKKINQWKKHQHPSELTKVVESAYNLSQLPDLESLLDRISNDKMVADVRRSLLNAIKKVARYRTAARVLYRAAKKFPIARRMNFVPVNLHEDEFTKVSETMQSSERGISEALSRTTLSEGERKQINSWYGWLKTDHEKADQRFKEQKMQILAGAKIHAEVQLVFFCEANNFEPPPRIISSSKDACFLCNALINVHGKHHIPRGHGRLYPGWRLPWFAVPNSIQILFAKHLEDVISGSITTMIQSQGRIKHPYPNESTAVTVTTSKTTVGGDDGCRAISSRSNSPAKLVLAQPVPIHDLKEFGEPARNLKTKWLWNHNKSLIRKMEIQYYQRKPKKS
ncbi:unnamed protein product [Clonostachys byssicola]|uniref:Uncharacterized protein n=1 Tax=Clonostachys byssicola TaxID=160290 RepID=A0A9N9U2A2_9HYPO|nr:unnamed protein product [Clonostachys byssicola]